MGEWFHGQRRARYHGLVNQGATCYLNSVLQVLFMTKDFRERITSHSHRNHAGKEQIESELSQLFSALEENYADTSNITRKLRIENVFEQRDAAEHYEKILRLTSPEASQIFHGELINRNKCCNCGTVTGSVAGFWSLPLPLVDNNNEYSVEKGIEDFFSSSEISGENQMYCETCDDKHDAVLDCVVKHYPEVLVLLLKRFELKFDGKMLRKLKINCPVKMPDTLQMAENQIHKLYAYVEHFGDLRHGHYIARIQSQDDGLWYIFDDLNVEVSNYNHFQLDPTETSKNVYLLFYQRQKDIAVTNMGRPEISPATTSNRTEDEHSLSEKKEKDETHSKAFDKKFTTKDQHIRPASKRSRPGRDDFHSTDEGNQAKRGNTSRKCEFGQDKCNEKSQESIGGQNVSNNSIFPNNTDCVIEIPDDTHVRPSKDNFDPVEHKYRESLEEKSYRDSNNENAKSLSGTSTQVKGVDYQWEDKAVHERQQSRRAVYSSEEDSYSKATWDKQHVIQRDTRLAEYRQDVQRYKDGNNQHRQVQRSHSCSPSQSGMLRNHHEHSNISYPGKPKERRGGSLIRRYHDFNQEWFENETTKQSGSRQQYRSQDVQLENFSKETQRNKMTNGGQKKNVRRNAQNYSREEHVSRLSQEVPYYKQPAAQKPEPCPQQCLEKMYKKQSRGSHSSYRQCQSQRSNRGHDGGHSLGRGGDGERKTMENKSKNYTGQNAKRNDSERIKSHDSITSRRAEITPDNLTEEVKSLVLNDSSKTQDELQGKVVPETNPQSRKKKCCRFWCRCCFCPWLKCCTK